MPSVPLMSRNIGQRCCNHCGHDVVLVGQVYTASPDRMGVYAHHYQGRAFCDAECPACLAQYIAWDANKLPIEGSETHSDLSYRHSFNDEPDERDLPRYTVERRWVRTGVWGADPTDKHQRAYMRFEMPKRA